MSKKKAFSGSTMTLKDFHGGSIPSDIPLPSAPGVIVRPTDRPSYDRQGSWGNHIGRSDHRLRPNSSGLIRSLDDTTPFLTDTANIGRNFDEDERKPLDGISRPRRTVSDESLGGSQAQQLRADAGRPAGYHQPQGSVSGLPMPASSVGPYAARVVEGVSRAPSSGGSNHNAWDIRKEALGAPETTVFSGAGPTTASKFAQASALEKVSSGRWQTKLFHHPADVEVIRQPESNLPSRDNRDNYQNSVVNERDSSEATLAKHVERGLTFERGTRGGAPPDFSDSERRSPVSVDGRDRISGPGSRAALTDPVEKKENAQSQLPVEASERPKLKLLPRTKPLEATEPPVISKQRSEENHLGLGGDQQGNINHPKSGPAVAEAGDSVTERPKLNLKPRTHPYELSDKISEKERKALFGGARPRELVLKERGVDDIVNNQEVVQSPISTHDRAKNDAVMRTETIQAHPIAQRQSGRVEHFSHDHRSPKNIDRSKDQRINTEKAEADLRKNWRNENWKNGANRDVEKPQNNPHLLQHNQERSRSPETWRKPVEDPKPQGVRYGKAVSAVELVQSFTKPVSSVPKPAEQFSSSKGRTSNRGPQVPFSRLMGSTTTQVNGY